MAASAPLSMIARIFQSHVSIPAASAAGSFCFIASSDMPKTRILDAPGDQHGGKSAGSAPVRHRRADPRTACKRPAASRFIGKVTSWYPSQLKGRLERRQRIGEHRQREVMPRAAGTSDSQ